MSLILARSGSQAVPATLSWRPWQGWSLRTTRALLGIVGVVADSLGRAGIPTASLWASVPHYVSQSSSPKATLALVERTARVLGAKVDVVELRISAAAYERQISELVASDEDAAAYVTRLEEQDAEPPPAEDSSAANEEGPRLGPASGERLAAEVERYLREQRRD